MIANNFFNSNFVQFMGECLKFLHFFPMLKVITQLMDSTNAISEQCVQCNIKKPYRPARATLFWKPFVFFLVCFNYKM